ncbi:LOW QUALITY PROTEIN: hypothetical protein TorRG33x02_010710 [Trema orientale]|uniref:Uncharacterized protein n=1 Tax=Trema orientale TaxID=63057 RepID=A0A2P5FYY5_TREOI|nr:LOW QUALITY PROTEIN: hypothetical protein TorRG33x02_010710 [Trema orientale]
MFLVNLQAFSSPPQSFSVKTSFMVGLFFPFNLKHLTASLATENMSSSPASPITLGSKISRRRFVFVNEMKRSIRLKPLSLAKESGCFLVKSSMSITPKL